MNWYYVEDGKQAGPVSQEQFDALCNSGKVTEQTLVWREGMPDWKLWASIRTAGAPPVFGTAGGVVCASCGKPFRPEEVIRIQDRFVCATCKPAYLQRVREGVSGTGLAAAGAGTVSIEEIEARDYEHDLGSYINQGWALFTSDPGIIIGASVLAYACIAVPQVIAQLLGMIPIIGLVFALPLWLGMLVVTGPVMGGLWYFYVKKVRGEPVTIGDAFKGFGPKFGQLFLTHLVSTLIAFVCYIPGAVFLVIPIAMAEAQRRSSPMETPMGIGLLITGGLLLFAGLCTIIYLTVCWMFALPLVADKGLNFWPAMNLSRRVVSKHWWMGLLVFIVLGFIGAIGLIACGAGLLVSAPVAFASFAYAYQKLFGDLAPQG